ncbi:DciA family protein [Ottowia sp.]|uniref:DciA family protein n=1 Tax=Ottowia sp. TaxID=1898956 RepID=UPI0039E5B3D8
MNSSKRPAVSLQNAVEQVPTLARLGQLAAESAARLRAVQPLLPPGLRELVRPGPIEEESWCLLVPHNAAAAKLRQLTPALLASLRAAGYPVGAIRIKVMRAN